LVGLTLEVEFSFGKRVKKERAVNVGEFADEEKI
jgi:hypothetical protein